MLLAMALATDSVTIIPFDFHRSGLIAGLCSRFPLIFLSSQLSIRIHTHCPILLLCAMHDVSPRSSQDDVQTIPPLSVAIRA